MSKPSNQNLSKPTQNVEKFQDTNNVTDALNFPLDTDGNPMLTGDGSGLTNVGGSYNKPITFVGAVSGDTYYGFKSGTYPENTALLYGVISPSNGDVLPGGPYALAIALGINGEIWFSADNGVTWRRPTAFGNANFQGAISGNNYYGIVDSSFLVGLMFGVNPPVNGDGTGTLFSYGYCVVSGFAVYLTVDGGTTWTLQPT
jgi:hypothetical protein